jgi:hypothetical protein
VKAVLQSAYRTESVDGGERAGVRLDLKLAGDGEEGGLAEEVL